MHHMDYHFAKLEKVNQIVNLQEPIKDASFRAKHFPQCPTYESARQYLDDMMMNIIENTPKLLRVKLQVSLSNIFTNYPYHTKRLNALKQEGRFSHGNV